MDKKKIAALNKSRARSMEKTVARMLSGNRVPMSGSGAIKGDCIVPLDQYRSIYVECKLTAQETLRLETAWLSKAKAESKAMRCVFPILVYHFHRSHDYYVLVPEDAQAFITLHTTHGIGRIDYVNAKAMPVTPEWAKRTVEIDTSSGIWYNRHIDVLRSALGSLTENEK